MRTESIKEALSYDPVTGWITWKIDPAYNVKAGSRAGVVMLPFGYRQITYQGKRYRSARLAWFLYYGVWPSKFIDHIDGNPANEKIENLRDVSCQENGENQRQAHSTSSSGLLGVHKGTRRKKDGALMWIASIKVDGKQLRLGQFINPLEAQEAYLSAKKRLHKGCTI